MSVITISQGVNYNSRKKVKTQGYGSGGKNQVATSSTSTQNSGSVAQGHNAKKAPEGSVERFKQLDTDGDMHLSKKELVDNAIKEYVANGYELNEGSIDDILADIANNVKEFGGEDGELNIDEYRAMVEAQIKKKEAHQTKVDEITKMKEASQNSSEGRPPEPNPAEYSGTVTGTVTSDIYTNGKKTDEIEHKYEEDVSFEK